MLEEERTKSKAGRRVVDLDPATVNVLRRWRRNQEVERQAWGVAYLESGMVFTAEDGQAFYPDRVAQAFDRFVRAAQVPVIRFPDLRHTSASHSSWPSACISSTSPTAIGDTPETILSTCAHFIPGQGQAEATACSEMVDGRRRERDASE